MKRECVVCGDAGDVRVGLVEWKVPVDGQRWTTMPRCVDRQACRDRLEAAGEEWDFNDRTFGRVKREPTAEPVVEESWL